MAFRYLSEIWNDLSKEVMKTFCERKINCPEFLSHGEFIKKTNTFLQDVYGYEDLIVDNEIRYGMYKPEEYVELSPTVIFKLPMPIKDKFIAITFSENEWIMWEADEDQFTYHWESF